MNTFDKDFNLTHFEIYEQEQILRKDTVYIITADYLYPYQLQIIPIEKGAAIIYLGDFPEECFSEEASYLILNNQKINVFVIINQIRKIFDKYNKLENDLFEAVYGKKPIQHMVNLMTPVVCNELTIRDNEYRYLAHSYEQIQLYALSKLPLPENNKGIIPVEVIDLLKNNPNYAKEIKSDVPLTYQDDYLIGKTLYYDVFTDDQFLCRIKLTEIKGPLRHYDSGLLLFFARFVKLRYELNFDLRISNNLFSLNKILIQLIQDSSELSSQELTGRLASKNWKLEHQYLCACLKPSLKDVQMRTLDYYSNFLSGNYSDLLAFEYQEQIICVINLTVSYQQNKELFISKFAFFLREENFRAGYSLEFAQLMQLRYYFKQAQTALELGNMYKPTIWSHHFEDTLYYYILQQFKEDFCSVESCSRSLEMLKQSDDRKQTQYLQTLRVYLNNHLNSVQAAKDLFIHRATLKYCLDKIKALTKIDFEDNDTILALQLLLKLMELDA